MATAHNLWRVLAGYRTGPTVEDATFLKSPPSLFLDTFPCEREQTILCGSGK